MNPGTMSSGSNRNWIGVPLPTRTWELTAGEALAYAAATGDDNPCYQDERPVAPPMSIVVGTVGVGLRGLFENEEFIGSPDRFLRLVHTEEDIRWNAPVPVGVPQQITTTVLDIDDRSVGEILCCETVVCSEAGEVLATALTTTVIRDPKPRADRIAGARKPTEEPAALAAPDGQVLTAQWIVAGDQAERYAEASGDKNPIHLDDDIARQAGLKGRILHGLCTMAFAQRVLIERVAGGDPSRLKRLRVKFSRPVYLGDTLTCALQPVAIRGHYRVTVQNQGGKSVLRDGIAEVQSET